MAQLHANILKYDIGGVIGHGAFGEVMAGRRKSDGMPVSIP